MRARANTPFNLVDFSTPHFRGLCARESKYETCGKDFSLRAHLKMYLLHGSRCAKAAATNRESRKKARILQYRLPILMWLQCQYGVASNITFFASRFPIIFTIHPNRCGLVTRHVLVMLANPCFFRQRVVLTILASWNRVSHDHGDNIIIHQKNQYVKDRQHNRKR